MAGELEAIVREMMGALDRKDFASLLPLFSDGMQEWTRSHDVGCGAVTNSQRTSANLRQQSKMSIQNCATCMRSRGATPGS